MKYLKQGLALLALMAMVSRGVLRADEPPAPQAESPQKATLETVEYPIVCVLWEIMLLEANAILYYAEYNEFDCNDPIGVYAYGLYDMSPGCDVLCFNPTLIARRVRPEPLLSDSTRPFPGLKAPIRWNEDYLPPAGGARTHTDVLHYSELPFIEFRDVRNQLKRAKVFQLYLNREDRYNDPSLTNERIYLALEVEEPLPPGARVQVVAAKEIDVRPAVTTLDWNSYAYRTTYRSNAGKNIPILILTAKSAGEPTPAKPADDAK